MSDPISRAEAIAVLEEGCQELLSLVAQLSPEAAKSGMLGGGEWSVHDLVGHIETWEQAALDTLEDLKAGRPVRMDQTVTDVKTMDDFNAAAVSSRSSRSLEESLARHEEVHANLIRAIQELTDEEWGRGHPEADGTTRTWGAKLGSNTGSKGRPFGHVYAHLDDVRALKLSVEASGAESNQT